MHESRAQASVSLAQQHQACGVTPISSALTGLISSLAFALAWVCVLPLLWAGQQARYCYMCCLHHLPGYKSELSAAAAKQQIEKAELQQELLCQLAKQHDTAAKQLAMKDSELAAFQASGQFAQSEVDRVQRQLDALTAAHSDVQHQLDSSAYQSEQMKKRLDAKDAEIATVCASQHSALKEQEQQHQQALHAVEEAAEAMVSAAIDQTATANAAADAAHCSKQSVLRKVQSDRDQLSSAVHQLEQERQHCSVRGSATCSSCRLSGMKSCGGSRPMGHRIKVPSPSGIRQSKKQGRRTSRRRPCASCCRTRGRICGRQDWRLLRQRLQRRR